MRIAFAPPRLNQLPVVESRLCRPGRVFSDLSSYYCSTEKEVLQSTSWCTRLGKAREVCSSLPYLRLFLFLSPCDLSALFTRKARVLRTMHSDDEPERAGVGRGQQGGGHRGLKTHSADAGPSSSETGDRGANENQNERVGGERPCEHPDERNQKDRTSSLAPNPGNNEDLLEEQTMSAGGLRPSPPQVAGFSGEMERDETFGRMPWWAGAFGAVPRMRDSPQARGLYVLRFCDIFFPDNVATATEARIRNLQAFRCRNRPATVVRVL